MPRPRAVNTALRARLYRLDARGAGKQTPQGSEVLAAFADGLGTVELYGQAASRAMRFHLSGTSAERDAEPRRPRAQDYGTWLGETMAGSAAHSEGKATVANCYGPCSILQ